MCNCIIYHPTPGTEDWDAVVRNFESARGLGDINGMVLLLAQLTGSCPERDKEEE